MSNGNAKSNEESGSNEHGEIDTDRLQDHAEDHNDATDHDARTSAQDICNIGNYREGNNRSNGHNCVKKTPRGSVWLIERYYKLS
jgi:hypothetical protein